MITRIFTNLDDFLGAIRNADELGLNYEARAEECTSMFGVRFKRWIIEINGEAVEATKGDD